MPRRAVPIREQPWVIAKLPALPEGPGVYFFKDTKGKVLYVGKAKSIRKRVSSYFSKNDHTLKTRRMLAQARDVEYLNVDSELEALVVEASCIKKYQPRYNVALKDDKSYPYLKLTLNEPFPKAEFTRTLVEDGARYYGPLSAGSVRAMVFLIQNVFQIRDCDLDMAKVHPRPCLQFQIKKCSGPCIRAVDEAAYGQQIAGAMAFLEGEAEGVLESLEAEMLRASLATNYERAAIFRDQLLQVRKFLENQKVVTKKKLDQDFVATRHVGIHGVGAVMTIRSGKIVGREQFPLKVPAGSTPEEVLSTFVGQYYSRVSLIPHEIHVAVACPDFPEWEAVLTAKKGRAVRFRIPARGEPRRLMEMVQRNAELYLSEEMRRAETAAAVSRTALRELQRALNLKRPPHRIECYDISNLGASNKQRTAVASRVVFLDGRPAKDHYRRYRIQKIDWQDDYAMLRETLRRRLAGYTASAAPPPAVEAAPEAEPATAKHWRRTITMEQAREQVRADMEAEGELREVRGGEVTEVGHGLGVRLTEEEPLAEPDAEAPVSEAIALPPEPEPSVLEEDPEEADERIDLMLIDGGRTHLNVALEVIRELGLEGKFEVAGLAKRHEELIVPWASESVLLPDGSPGLFLVQRVRDEAHRFANAYRKILVSRALQASELDAIAGIGPKRKALLLKHFGGLKKLKAATIAEIAMVPGFNQKTATLVKAALSAPTTVEALKRNRQLTEEQQAALNPYSGE